MQKSAVAVLVIFAFSGLFCSAYLIFSRGDALVREIDRKNRIIEQQQEEFARTVRQANEVLDGLTDLISTKGDFDMRQAARKLGLPVKMNPLSEVGTEIERDNFTIKRIQ